MATRKVTPKATAPVMPTSVSTGSDLYTGAFWKQTSTMVVHSAAVGALGALGTHQVGVISSLPWQATVSSAVVGALVGLLTNLASVGLPHTKPAGFATNAPVNEDAAAVANAVAQSHEAA